jgi:hypothetical protein
MQCVVTASLPKGQLTFQGLSTESEKASRLASSGALQRPGTQAAT